MTDTDGKPVAAEVELGIVDQSLFDLAEDNAFDIRSYFFPSPALQGDSSFGWVTVPFDDCFAGDRFADLAFAGNRLQGGGSGGGGFGGGVAPGFGGGGGGLSVAVPAETEIRSNFADTFYWSAHVCTGDDGRAELEIEVPDTLGQWRIVARAISDSDRFGVATSGLVSRKDAIVRLSTPRFFTQGDQAIVSTVVNNHLEKDASFVVTLECEGGLAGGQQTRTIPAAGQVRIDWPIAIERSGTVMLRAQALSETASDAMELKLPVRPYGIEKRIARNGRLADGVWNTSLVVPDDADPDSSRLDIVVGSASTEAVRDALPYLANYPYGCVEQTMSRFLPAVVASTAMKRQGVENKELAEQLPHMVQQGLQLLYGFQHDAGGWGWWKNDETDEFMTTYVVFGLLTAERAGYEVSEQTVQQGVEAVQSMVLTPFSAYVRRMANAEVKFELDEIQRREQPPGNPIGTEDLAYLVLAGFKELAEQLPLDPPKHSDPDTVRTAALLVRALASVDADDKRIPPLVDWLMQQRRGGAWYSTLDTAYAVFGLSTLSTPADNPPVQITVNGMRTESTSGRLSLSSRHLRPGESNIEIRQPDGNVVSYASVLLTWFAADLDQSSREDSALVIRREIERSVIVDGTKTWKAIESGARVTVNDELRVTTIVNRNDHFERVMIESPLPAGTEPHIDDADHENRDDWFGRRELRDERVSVAASGLYGDTNRFECRLRPTLPGRYRVLPARVFPMYDPDQQAYSSAFVLEVVESR